MLIGFTGRIGSGKTTAAKVLVNRWGFAHYAFAAPLKKAVSLLFDIPLDVLKDSTAKEEYIDTWGMSARQIMQTFGSECMRNNFGADFWCKLMKSHIDTYEHTNFVIDDVRFIEEVRTIQEMDGTIINVDRPGNPFYTGSTHVSETLGIVSKDIKIINSGSITDLHDKVNFIMDRLTSGKSSTTFNPIS